MDMQRDIAEILKRLEALRARSKELGKQRENLNAHIDEAVAQLHRAAEQMAESKAVIKDTPSPSVNKQRA
ncbi:MAG: hypothetical protein ACREHD_27540 [Pirellulales bacterium]